MSETPATPTVKPVDPAEFKEVNIGAEINEQTQPPSDHGKAETFDPKIHCSNSDGTPKRNGDGTFRKKPLPKNAKKVEAEVIEDNAFENPAPLSTVQMVEMILGVGTMFAVSQLGEEWKPTESEAKMMTDIYSRYLHYKGWDMEASPEFVLVGVTLAYLMPRIMTPKFLARFKRVENTNAQSNNRANGNGQNNTGENHGETVNGSGAGSDRVRPPIERLG